MPETDQLYDTVVAWWEAIVVLVATGATTARVETADTQEHQRTGRGFTNSTNNRARILALRS